MKIMNVKEAILEYSIPEPNSGCWLWTRSWTHQGYGQLGSRLVHHAHRGAYMVFKGDIPEGMYVCHKCDTRCCVNPDHLFLGNHQDNMDDMTKKGRKNLGSRHHYAIFNEQVVRKIIEARLQESLSHKELAERFGYTKRNIKSLFGSKAWAYIKKDYDMRPLVK